jgi:hypothetical protein
MVAMGCRRRGSCQGGAPAAQRGRTTLTATSGDTGCDGEGDRGMITAGAPWLIEQALLSQVWAVHERRRPALSWSSDDGCRPGDMMADRVIPARFATAQSVRVRRRGSRADMGRAGAGRGSSGAAGEARAGCWHQAASTQAESPRLARMWWVRRASLRAAERAARSDPWRWRTCS